MVYSLAWSIAWRHLLQVTLKLGGAGISMSSRRLVSGQKHIRTARGQGLQASFEKSPLTGGWGMEHGLTSLTWSWLQRSFCISAAQLHRIPRLPGIEERKPRLHSTSLRLVPQLYVWAPPRPGESDDENFNPSRRALTMHGWQCAWTGAVSLSEGE